MLWCLHSCGQLQHLPGLQSASPAVCCRCFGRFFQGGVWKPANRSLPPPWRFPTMELLKPPVALLPPHFVMKNGTLAARQGTEQPRSQNETCREFPGERLPSRWLIRPRGSQSGIQAASQEGISSCSGPGARVPPEPRTSSCCQSLGSVAGWAGPCTSLMLSKCWLLNRYIGRLIRRKDEGGSEGE